MPILAYFLTWSMYGTWLPGDRRGWVHHKDGAWHVDFRPAEPDRQNIARALMNETSIILNDDYRTVVDATIRQCCHIKGWLLHAVNVRTNHVHVVVSCEEITPERVMSYFKAWCSRRLNELSGISRTRWWTRHGSTRYVKTDDSLRSAIEYTKNQ